MNKCPLCKQAFQESDSKFKDVRENVWHTKCFLEINRKDYGREMLNAAEIAGIDLSKISDWNPVIPSRKPELPDQHLDIDYINTVGGS